MTRVGWPWRLFSLGIAVALGILVWSETTSISERCRRAGGRWEPRETTVYVSTYMQGEVKTTVMVGRCIGYTGGVIF